VPAGNNVVIERVQITPSGSGSLTIALSNLLAATTEGNSDGAPFASLSIDPSAVTVTVEIPTWNGHPGDTNEDWVVVIDEVTAYAACWKTGCTWSVPPSPIPIAYVTREGYLWSVGERYYRDSINVCDGEKADCYQPGLPPAMKSEQVAWRTLTADAAVTPAFGASRIIERSDGAIRAYRVRLDAVPPADARSWAVEELVPMGWNARDASDDATVDVTTGRVRWGLFRDCQPRVLSYTLVANGDSPMVPERLAGVMSADGRNVQVSGAASMTSDARAINMAERDTFSPVTALCGAGVCEAAIGLSGITLLFCRRKRRSD
jgi:hypothetical protein